jgi:hypothetical protein
VLSSAERISLNDHLVIFSSGIVAIYAQQIQYHIATYKTFGVYTMIMIDIVSFQYDIRK